MQKYTGILGIIAILLIGYIFSNNRKLIDYKLIAIGVLLQALTGYFILKVPLGKYIFEILARGVTAILELSKAGGKFVFGPLANQSILSQTFGSSNSFIFIIQIVPTIVFICALVSALYYFHILQYIVKAFAWLFNKLLGVSGAEALANSLVAIVGQVESAIIVQPYLGKMTKSEILTIMTGGMACISGSLMAIYSSFGIKTEYLLAASFMAIPGSFVLSKIFYPEDKIPLTRDTVHVGFKIQEKNLVESILDGAYSGIKISVGVIAMLIAFVSLIAMIDKLLFLLNPHLSLKLLLGYLFTPIVYLFGVPSNDINTVAQLLGTKISLNEFVAYIDFSKIVSLHTLNPKTIAITTFMLCGFANFSSIAIQVGGLSQMAPERKSDFAELGFKAMVCGALASCVSGCIVGILV